MRVGPRLRELREWCGVMAQDAAGVAGISMGHLHRIEEGREEPEKEVLGLLCAYYGIPVSEIRAKEWPGKWSRYPQIHISGCGADGKTQEAKVGPQGDS